MALFLTDLEVDRRFPPRTLVSGHGHKNLYLNDFLRAKRTKAAHFSSTALYAIPGWEPMNCREEVFLLPCSSNCLYLFVC